MDGTARHIERAIGIYMEGRDMTQTQMASELGMTTNTLRAKKRGDSDWTWGELLKLCKLLNLTPNELTGWK